MSDPSPSDAAEAGPTTSRLDELIEELRAAYAPDATPQARYATAVNITRALVGGTPPAPEQRNAAPPPSATPPPGDGPVPVDALLNALSSMPREQLGALAGTVAVPILEYVTARARSFFAHSQPTYLSRPAVPRPPPPPPSPPAQPTRAGRRS